MPAKNQRHFIALGVKNDSRMIMHDNMTSYPRIDLDIHVTLFTLRSARFVCQLI